MKFKDGVFCALALMSLLSGTLYADEQIVFSGYPSSKVESSSENTSRLEVSERDAVEYKALIIKRDGKYIWASRDNVELMHFRSGVFDWFVSPSSGYIKTVDRRMLFDDENSQYLYMEHLTLHLSTITYWGAGEKFNP